MTVQELIDQLMLVEDKNAIVKLDIDTTVGYVHHNTSSTSVWLTPERRKAGYKDLDLD